MSKDNNVIMTKISTSNKVSTVYGPGHNQPICMFTFVTGEGKKKTSTTRHMTEADANVHKQVLGGK